MDLVDEFYADKDLSLLKKLTLVIPTYNRNYYLSRCLWYHAHFPFGEIIVADSSPEEKKVVNRDTVAKVRARFGANVRYLEYEPETEKYGGDIYRKWGDAVQHVETEYSQICTDKEFMLPFTLCQEIAYLEQNLDYVSVESLRCWVDNTNKNGLVCLLARDFQKSSSINTINPKERYIQALTETSTAILILYRTKIHKKIYQYLENYNIQDIRFGETLVSIIGYILGKSHHTNETISLCRDVTNLNRSGRIDTKESTALRYPPISEYKTLGVLNQFYIAYKNCLKDVLTDILIDDDLSDIDELILKSDCLINNTSENGVISILYHYVMTHKSIKKIWMQTPRLIKQPIRILTGYDDSRWQINNVPNDVILIEKIIEMTMPFHLVDTDNSLFNTNLKVNLNYGIIF